MVTSNSRIASNHLTVNGQNGTAFKVDPGHLDWVRKRNKKCRHNLRLDKWPESIKTMRHEFNWLLLLLLSVCLCVCARWWPSYLSLSLSLNSSKTCRFVTLGVVTMVLLLLLLYNCQLWLEEGTLSVRPQLSYLTLTHGQTRQTARGIWRDIVTIWKGKQQKEEDPVLL